MSTPRSVDIEITSKCNLRCVYCSHFSGPGDVSDLPTAEWLKFFGELGRCAVMDVTLSGGELFLRKDLKEIIEGIVRNRMRFAMLTNGTLITEDMACFLASTGRCKLVQVSLDGSRAPVHEASRGKGTFDRALNGLKLLKAYNIPVTVRVTLNRNNVNEIDDIARFLLEEIGLPSFSTNSADYLGLCQDNDRIQLTVEDRMKAMASLARLNKKYDGRIIGQAGPLAEAIAWSAMEKARIEGTSTRPNRGYLASCGCVYSKIAVRSDGVIVPCSLLDHIELGKINKDDLKEVWQHHPVMEQMRQRRTIPLSNFVFCRGCDYINYCTGNCPATAYTMTGDVYHPSPDGCLRRFIEGGGRLTDIMAEYGGR